MKRQICNLIFLIVVWGIVLTACNPVNLVEPAIATMVTGAIGDSASTQAPVASNLPRIGGLDGFGMGSSTYLRTTDIESQYREMANLGIRYIREEIPWSEVQPNPRSFSLDYRNGALYHAMELSKKYQLEVVALLAYSPGFEPASKTEFLAFWSKYVSAIVERFGAQIDYWEIGNEMNTWWNKVRPGRSFEADWYVAMLAEAYKIIKAADPNDTVIIGGLVNTDSPAQGLDPFEVLRQLGTLHAAHYADALGLHLYWPNQLPEESKANLAYGETVQLNMPDYVREFIRQSQRHLGRNLPVWVTETGLDLNTIQGLASKLSIEAEHIQAVSLARTYLHLLSIPEVRAVFWYTWLNDNTRQSYAMNVKSKKVLQTMTTVLNGAEALGRVSVLDESGAEENCAWDYRFLRVNGETVAYYWTLDNSLDTGEARITPADHASLNIYNADQLLIDQPRVVVAGDSFNLISVPGLMIGPLQANQHIQIISQPTQTNQRYPLAYTKGGNIWVYYPDTQKKQQVTSDGQMTGSLDTFRYTNPKVSANGEWVAFTSPSQFVLYHLESGRYRTIPINSPSDMVGDTLLGWDRDNNFYFTRTIGICDLSKTPMQGPDATEVYRFDPVKESSELVYRLPSSDEASHAYWIGTAISSLGRYASFSYTACNIGGIFTTYIVDTQTGQQYRGSYGLSSVSNDETMYAYNDNSFFAHRGFVHPMTKNFATGELELLHVVAASMIWDQPNWSFDDRYVSFNASNIVDSSITTYDINMFGVAEYVGLTIYDRLADQPPIVGGAGPGDGRTYFRAWSPYNYDVAMVRYPEGFNPKYPSELWIYPMNSTEGLLVDSGMGIGEADW